MIRVVIADDHEIIRTGVSHLLEAEEDIEVVGEATTGEEAIALSRKLRPDIVLMDIKMPGIGGLEATGTITDQVPETKIIILTALETDIYPKKLLRAGALGFVSKSSGAEEILRAMRKVIGNQRYICPLVAQQMVLKQLTNEDGDSPFEALTEREFQVCIMIVNGQKTQEIANRLFLSPKTVAAYRYRIFEKLDIRSDVELARMAFRHGIVDLETD